MHDTTQNFCVVSPTILCSISIPLHFIFCLTNIADILLVDYLRLISPPLGSLSKISQLLSPIIQFFTCMLPFADLSPAGSHLPIFLLWPFISLLYLSPDGSYWLIFCLMAPIGWVCACWLPSTDFSTFVSHYPIFHLHAPIGGSFACWLPSTDFSTFVSHYPIFGPMAPIGWSIILFGKVSG